MKKITGKNKRLQLKYLQKLFACDETSRQKLFVEKPNFLKKKTAFRTQILHYFLRRSEQQFPVLCQRNQTKKTNRSHF